MQHALQEPRNYLILASRYSMWRGIRLTERQGTRRFSKKELSEFSGEDGRPAYVAFKGKVYDVSNSRLWTGGKHEGRHSAGDDLTESILSAPHSEEVFVKFQVVGELVEEEVSNQQLVRWLQKLHLHPISVHFSIAYSVAIPLLSVLYVLTGGVSFETASYYMLLLGFLSAPVAALSGFFSWKVTYEGRMTRIFARKLIFAVVLLVVITMCFLWRILNPGILIGGTELSYVYLAMIVSLVPIVTILGYYGGEIVYP
jgi:predicted heme/steroid binding protein/uncharacterized membrane protein